jgi:hypothetical protein
MAPAQGPRLTVEAGSAPVPWHLVHSLSRRRFLTGSAMAATAAMALAACGNGSGNGGAGGGDDGDGQPSDDTTLGGSNSGTAPGEIVLVRRFAPQTLVVGTQRVPIVLGDINGLLPLESTPARLTARVLDDTGKVIVESVAADRHGQELEQPYFPFALGLTAPGNYEVQLVDHPTATTTIDVHSAAEVPIPQPGSPLPPFDTPTVSNHRGVNPVCTREPACPLHDVTLTKALSEGKPVAYLIGTPAFCQTGVCGPVLDLLLAEHVKRSDYVMVHSEVYTDTTVQNVAPAVTAYHMNFEPSLFIADSKGMLVERLDSIYDSVELAAALDRASA